MIVTGANPLKSIEFITNINDKATKLMGYSPLAMVINKLTNPWERNHVETGQFENYEVIRSMLNTQNKEGQ